MSIDVAMVVRLVQKTTAPAQAAIKNIKGIHTALKGLDSRAMIDAHNQRMQAYRAEALEAAALGYALFSAIKPAIQFESSIADVKKVVSFDGPGGIKALSKDILELSTKIPIAADGLAQIVAAAGQANVVDAMLPDADKRRLLVAFAEDAAKMAVAFDIGAGTAGEAMAGLRNIFGLTQEQVISTADAVNHLSNNMAAAASPILQFLERAGGDAKALGLTAQQTAALGATLLALKVPAAEAGTSISAVFTRLLSAKDQTDSFRSALKQLGLSQADLSIAIKKDAQGAFLGLLEQIRDSGDATSLLFRLFGQEHVGKLQKLIGGLDQYKRALGLVANETEYAGSMQSEYEARAATTENALQLLNQRWMRLTITIGSTVLPHLVELVETLSPIIEKATAWADANPELVSGIIKLTAGLVAFRLVLIAVKFLFGWIWGAVLRGIWLFQKFAVVLPYVRAGLMLVGRALLFIGRALLLNPIGLAITAIAGAAYLIYDNWSDLAPWFQELWDDIVEIHRGFFQIIAGIFTLDMDLVIKGLKTAWEGLRSFFQTLWDGILGIFKAAWQKIKPIVDLFTGVTKDITAAQAAVGRNAGAPAGFHGPSNYPSVSGVPNPKRPSARMFGGPVMAGLAYVVGERGREYFVPDTSGFIVPTDHIDRRPPMSAGGSSGGTYSPTVNIYPQAGQDAREIADEVMRRINSFAAGGAMHDGGIQTAGAF